MTPKLRITLDDEAGYAAFRCARRTTAFAMYSASLAAPWIIVDDIA